MEPVRIEWPGDRGDWPDAGDYGWASGAGTDESVRPRCPACGRVVGWRELRYRAVEQDGRVLVEQDGQAWHGGCRVRARGAAVAAASRDLVGAAGIVGAALVRLVPPIVDGVRPVVEAGVPLLAERGRLVVEAARGFVDAGRVEARRRWRRVPLDRVGRPAGWAAGVVVDGAAGIGWRLDLVRSRVVAAWTEWRRGVGYTRAWRVALDGHDDVAPAVVAVRTNYHPIRLRWAGAIDPRLRGSAAGEAAADGSGMGPWVDPSAIRRAIEDEAGPRFQRAYLDGWLRGPAGHGDVDTPQRRHRDGQQPGDNRR